MKKLILSVSAIAGLSLAAHSQGISFADNSASASANGYDTTINGQVNTQDLNLALLIGSATPNTPVVTLLLSDPTVTTSPAIGQVSSAVGDVSAAGYIFDPSSQAYVVSAFAGQTVNAEVEAWTGNYPSYAEALASGVTGEFAGVSQVFTAAIPATSTGFAADISNVGVINLIQVPTVVPEPSTLAMAGVGLASMLIFRRRNK
jgi:hypothetical protein